MAVTAVGHAWTCGGNDCGQLGVGDTANRLGFTRVDAGQLGGARIVMGACGLCHSVVVSAEGRVWTFGCGRGLGLNDEQHRLVPTLLAPEVFKGSKMVTVAAGGFHTMAVGVDGALWAWGRGSSGQLGARVRPSRAFSILVSISTEISCHARHQRFSRTIVFCVWPGSDSEESTFRSLYRHSSCIST